MNEQTVLVTLRDARTGDVVRYADPYRADLERVYRNVTPPGSDSYTRTQLDCVMMRVNDIYYRLGPRDWSLTIEVVASDE